MIVSLHDFDVEIEDRAIEASVRFEVIEGCDQTGLGRQVEFYEVEAGKDSDAVDSLLQKCHSLQERLTTEILADLDCR